MAVVSRRAQTLLAVLAAALALAALARLPFAWASGNGLNHVAGAWMALARDLGDGVLYRPLHADATGYGGTRFFPLWFSLHAALVAAGADPVRGGFLLALASGLAVPGAAYLLLRRLGVERGLAATFAALVLAGFAVQYGLATIRGDLLPVALSLAGLAAVAGPRGRAAVPLGATLLVLAFAAKPTALSAAFAAAVWLHLRGDRRAALSLAGFVALGAGTALSGGRFLEILRACATDGMTAADLARAPVRVLETLALEDRATLVTVLGATAALAVAARTARGGLGLPALWLVASAGSLLGVFSIPGMGVNHLAELQVSAAVALGVVASRPGAGARVAALGGIAAAAAGLLVAGGLVREDLARSRVADARRVLAALPRGDAPILSEDPLVPVLGGDRPYLLDAFMFRLVAERDPSRARPLVERLERGEFPAVVLLRDARHDVDGWYARKHLGPAALAAIRARYRLASRAGPYFVYVPSPERGPVDADHAASLAATERR
jgi:hypothetical protein